MNRVTSSTAAHILDKTFYDLLHHPPESTDWLNVLLAQTMSQYRDDAQLNDRLILAIDEVLNGGVRPGFFVCIPALRTGLMRLRVSNSPFPMYLVTT